MLRVFHTFKRSAGIAYVKYALQARKRRERNCMGCRAFPNVFDSTFPWNLIRILGFHLCIYCTLVAAAAERASEAPATMSAGECKLPVEMLPSELQCGRGVDLRRLEQCMAKVAVCRASRKDTWPATAFESWGGKQPGGILYLPPLEARSNMGLAYLGIAKAASTSVRTYLRGLGLPFKRKRGGEKRAHMQMAEQRLRDGDVVTTRTLKSLDAGRRRRRRSTHNWHNHTANPSLRPGVRSEIRKRMGGVLKNQTVSATNFSWSDREHRFVFTVFADPVQRLVKGFTQKFPRPLLNKCSRLLRQRRAARQAKNTTLISISREESDIFESEVS
ncbi:hypothetical protein CYMTET_32730 [Cymbomonas tetramitiformis]|uniref:Uncharacterized protein n=1 Tax=Cymbomonas tetramitiformis TaxID=36881 RepID=A0AAE0FE88_9CHLO|nr:hypothetical protein CYMTET_32730 [Cymbomonas tetramitiformis]